MVIYEKRLKISKGMKAFGAYSECESGVEWMSKTEPNENQVPLNHATQAFPT